MINRLSISRGTDSPYAERQFATWAQPKHQTMGNPHTRKPEKQKLLKFHGSQNCFLFVDGWGEVVNFQQTLPALRHFVFTFLSFKHSEAWFSFLWIIPEISKYCLQCTPTWANHSESTNTKWKQFLVIKSGYPTLSSYYKYFCLEI